MHVYRNRINLKSFCIYSFNCCIC